MLAILMLASVTVAPARGAGVVAPAVAATDTGGLAPTPPMGWSNWAAFSPQSVTARRIRVITDEMATLGMREVGYEHVIVGAGWQASTRAADGQMRADPHKFPHGMKALADYVHSKGFQFGLQQAPGTRNCAGWPAPGTDTAPGATYEDRARFDADTFVRWGVDFIRLDGCGYQSARPAGLSPQEWSRQVYGAWRQALDATGRRIVLWGNGGQYDTPEMWAPLGVNVWRIKGDLKPTWDRVMLGLDADAPLSRLAAPGSWNDPDFLVLGTPRRDWAHLPDFTGGLTASEGRAQFSLWAILAAPLIASTNLRADSAFTIRTLTNRDVIAVDQDPLGLQGRRLRSHDGQEVWVKRLVDGSRAVVLFNRAATRQPITTSASRIGLPPAPRYFVHHLWSHCVSTTTGSLGLDVGPHAAYLARVSLERAAGWPRCAR